MKALFLAALVTALTIGAAQARVTRLEITSKQPFGHVPGRRLRAMGGPHQRRAIA